MGKTVWCGEHWPRFRIIGVDLQARVGKYGIPIPPLLNCIGVDGKRPFGITIARFFDELDRGNIYQEVPNGSSQAGPAPMAASGS